MNDDSWEFNVGRIFSPADQIRENQCVVIHCWLPLGASPITF